MAGESAIPVERIEKSIFLIRGKEAKIDPDLAAIFGVKTKRLDQRGRRDTDRFPPDFMFQFTREEKDEVAANCDHTGRLSVSPCLRFAFTEHETLTLPYVLNSPRAIQASLRIVRTCVRLRELLSSKPELAGRIDELEAYYDRQFKMVFDAIRQLIQPPEKPKNPIGIRVREKETGYRPGKLKDR